MMNYYQSQINIYRYISYEYIYILIKINMYIIWIITYNNIVILNFKFFILFGLISFITLIFFSLFTFSFYIIIIYYNYDEVVLLIGVFTGVLLFKLLLLVVGVIWDGIVIFWLFFISVIYVFNVLLLETICYDNPCCDDNITVKTLDKIVDTIE